MRRHLALTAVLLLAVFGFRPGRAGRARGRPCGAGGTIRRDRRRKLDGQYKLEDASAAGRVARSNDGRRRPVTELVLIDNGLAGPIPADLGSLANLWSLRLRSNELTGVIPRALSSLFNLRLLYLNGNALTGPVPPWLGNLSNLRMLYLGGNDLSGPIPVELGSLPNLEGLSLQYNTLTGPVPASLGSLANLKWLYLSGNELSGPIPAALGHLSNLEVLDLGRNELSGPIPAALDRLSSLEVLALDDNALTGPVPAGLGSLTNLERLDLGRNGLTGTVPASLGRLSNLESLSLGFNWGVSGQLPPDLRLLHLKELDALVSQACAPAAWSDWLATHDFKGAPLCGAGPDVTIDMLVVYTPAAREAAGGADGIEAVIDLMIAETNQAFSSSGVLHRLDLVATEEVSYAYSMIGRGGTDVRRLADPSDGYMDEVHRLRDRTGADLVHLIVEPDVGGVASEPIPSAFAITCLRCGALTFGHEVGHNLGILHDRYQVIHTEWERGVVSSHPAYGYVNQRAFETGAPQSSRWVTTMAYRTQCADANYDCQRLFRFSNPRQTWQGDPLGVPFGFGASGVTGPADAVAVINATGLAIAAWRDRVPAGANQPPMAVGTLPDRRLTLGGTLNVDVSQGFVDPDGDALTWTVSSAEPDVVAVLASGARVRLTAVAVGTSAVRVTATDPGGLNATQTFAVTVSRPPARPFTDHPIVPGQTPIRAVHFTELRTRIDAQRTGAGLAPYPWTDPVLVAGVTPVRLVHLTELRTALTVAYRAAGRPAPRWTDVGGAPGAAPIRAAHVIELRAAVMALE